MPTANPPAQLPWQLAGGTALLASTSLPLRLSASIDVERGTHALELAPSGGDKLASLWQLRELTDLPLREAYVRERDLVASYEPGPAFPFYTDIYWTWLASEEFPPAQLALQLLVSVRTDYLDTHPVVNLVSQFAGAEIELLEGAVGQGIRTPLSDDWHLVEFATTTDAPQLALSTDGPRQLATRELFAHFLEKGVIRRARLFMAIVPADTSPDECRKLCQELASSPWPLTA